MPKQSQRKHRKRNFPNSNSRRRQSSSSTATNHQDLFIPVPTKGPIAFYIRSIANRLQSIGYQTIALTYTTYGTPPSSQVASDVLPDTLFPIHPTTSNNNNNKTTKENSLKQLQLQPQTSSLSFTTTTNNPIQCKRRLHAVVESVSDVEIFSTKSSTTTWLDTYDLVSIAPRNQATFRQACLASHIDIITLDYATIRGGLPYTITSTDIQAIMTRGIVLEIPYAAAILQPTLRPYYIQTFREVQIACMHVTSHPLILLSSGPCNTTTTTGSEDNDITTTTTSTTTPTTNHHHGEMVLHSYTDILHMVTTITGLDVSWFRNASQMAIQHGQQRQKGYQPCMDVLVVSTLSDSIPQLQQQQKKSITSSTKLNKTMKPNPNPRSVPTKESLTENTKNENRKVEQDDEDGFIAF